MSSTSLPFPTLQNVGERFIYDQFDDFIGEGKFGNVYIAVDNNHQQITSNDSGLLNQQQQQSAAAQRVALKVVEKYKLENAKAFSDIVNEVEIARRVHHPNCVSIYDAVQSDDRIFIVQELIEGSDLQVLVSAQRGHLPENLVQALAAQLLYAVSCLHKQQICHRDIKPENVMISGTAIPVIGDDTRDLFDGSLKADQYLDAAKVTLVDFGLAKSLPKSSAVNNNSNNTSANNNNNNIKDKRRVVVGNNNININGNNGSTPATNNGGSFFTMTSTTTNKTQTLHNQPASPTIAMPHHHHHNHLNPFSSASSTPLSSQQSNGNINNNNSNITNSMSYPSTSFGNNNNNIGNGFVSNEMNSNNNGNDGNNNNNNNNQSQMTRCDSDSATPSCSQRDSEIVIITASQETNNISLSQGSNNNKSNHNNGNVIPASPTTRPNSIGLFPNITNIDVAVKEDSSAPRTSNGSSGELNNNNNSVSSAVTMTGLGSLPRQASLQSLNGGTNSPLIMTPCGTFGFTAPELMRHLAQMGVGTKQQTSRQEVYKRDIYSIGLVLYYSFVGKTPFSVRTAAALAKQMEGGPSFTGPVWDSISTDAKNFITLLLAHQAEARPTADVAMTHPWISGLVQKLKAKHSVSSLNSACSHSGSGSSLLQQDNNNNNNNASGNSLVRRKNNGRSYDDLAALHSIRANEAQEFDAICSEASLDVDNFVPGTTTVPNSERVSEHHHHDQEDSSSGVVIVSDHVAED
jgi:serine/threonine protein kinase